MKSARWMAAALALWIAADAADAGDFTRATALYRTRHYQEALDLLHPLAAAGDPYAQYTIGVMYDDGRGVPKNLRLAHVWYLKAARNGLADAQYIAGMFYAAGRGRPQDLVKAYIWFDLAAAGGFPRANRARDQEMGEMTPAELLKAQDMAVKMQRRQPPSRTCRGYPCIHPKWMDQPPYGLLD